MDGHDTEPAPAGIPSSGNIPTISERRVQNSKQSVNRLPLELLSRIFTIGGQQARSNRSRRSWYITFQRLSTRVCSHWRAVAIGSPALWTYIHITHPPPHELASLYLARAGTAGLLEVDIQIYTKYLNGNPLDTETQTYRFSRIVDLLISYGAGTNRWKSFTVGAEEPEALFKAIQLLNSNSAPALRYLSLRWTSCSPNPAVEIQSTTAFHLTSTPHSLSGASLPNLRYVELTAVPWRVVLDQQALLTGLTRLELTSAYYIHNLSALRLLLLSNPQLESLLLDSRFAGRDTWEEPVSQSVELSSLRSLSVGGRHPRWTLDVIQMIKAPSLEEFAFASVVSNNDGAIGILNYIATGMPPHDDAVELIRRPIYPTLREIDVSKIKSLDSVVATVLSSISSVTRLSIRGSQAEMLCNTPCVLPNLVSLKFPHSVHPKLGGLLRHRIESGFPIQVVELPANEWKYCVEDELPSTITVVEHFDVELHPGYGSGESDQYIYPGEDSDDHNSEFWPEYEDVGPGLDEEDVGDGEGEEFGGDIEGLDEGFEEDD